MSVKRFDLSTAHLPVELTIEAARLLARHEEFKLAETLLRWALMSDVNNESARRWLEFTLEAQNRFEEAYQIHIQAEPEPSNLGLN